MTSVPSRFIEASATSLMCSGRLFRTGPPPFIARGSALVSKPNLVAITTRSRNGASASPTNSSSLFPNFRFCIVFSLAGGEGASFFSRKRPSGRRDDVLIHPEHVVRVPARFHLGQPGVFRLSVGGLHALLALVAHEFDVRPAGGVWHNGVEEVTHPGGVVRPIRILRGPDAVDVDGVGGIPPGEPGGVL